MRKDGDRIEAIIQVWQAAQVLGWQFHGLTNSPTTGFAGNAEYLTLVKC